MSRTIPQRELRNDSAAVLRAVRAGETFVITNNGLPVAELRPTGQRRRLVPRTELEQLAGQLEPIDATRFRADLEALVDQNVEVVDGRQP
jgi:prevent-host-death family protein